MQRKRIFSGTKMCPQPPKGLKLKYKEQGNFEAIFAVLESQNCVNGPKSSILGQGITILH